MTLSKKVHIMWGMNKLPLEKRVQILTMLVEGSSLRSISRVAGVSINTVTKLLVDAGTVCATFHDEMVRNVAATRVQCDKIWSFCYAKPANAGDVWTWTGLDAESKLVVSWMAGGRDSDYAMMFMDDLRSRLANGVQLTTDGHKAYLEAVEGAFEGNPDLAHVSRSYTERHNLTMRMQMRRFTRLTNAFSKKVENHLHSLALYFVWYNWVRTHKAHKLAPAMAAGLTDKLMDMADIARMIDDAAMHATIEKQVAALAAPQSN